MGEEDQEIKAPSYKVDKSRGCDVRTGDTVNNAVLTLYGDRW